MMQTSSTLEIKTRAAAAIEAGHEYAYVAPDGVRVKIGYVAGGGFVRVEVRSGAGVLALTDAHPSIRIGEALATFHTGVMEASEGFEAPAVEAATARLLALIDAKIPPFGEIPDSRVLEIKSLREIRRAALGVLDERVV